MDQHNVHFSAWLRRSGLVGLAMASMVATGCSNVWLNGFIDPSQVGNFNSNTVNEIQRSISFRDQPAGIPGAVDPTPDDLVARIGEYEIGPGDVLSVRMLDFIQINTETELQPVVDELGYIDVSQLGWIRVEGLTTRQIQAEIIRRGKEAGIYPVEETPTVIVQVLTQQQRLYNVSGATSQPGPYRIPRPDFRLREAINQAGGLDETIRYVYVFRNETRRQRVEPHSSTMPGLSEPIAAPVEPTPPVSPVVMAEMSSGGGANSTPSDTPADAQAGLSLPADDAEQKELLEAVAPSPGTPSPHAAPAQAATLPSGTFSAPPTYIQVNGEWVLAPTTTTAASATQNAPIAGPATQMMPESTAAEPTSPSAPVLPPAVGPSNAEPVDWQELASQGQQRVIRISAEKLRQGDTNANIVIKHQDWVRLDPGPVGEFYLMGHVARPGVYAFTGREITLRQAVAAAGGFDPLAWPSRTEIVRRVDGDREETTQWDLARVMEGRDPDLFLKPGDVINVGTHMIAPFLMTIRNSFRFTYGFGFVYDRNFADVDAFYPQQNPTDRHRNERKQLLGL